MDECVIFKRNWNITFNAFSLENQHKIFNWNIYIEYEEGQISGSLVSYSGLQLIRNFNFRLISVHQLLYYYLFQLSLLSVLILHRLYLTVLNDFFKRSENSSASRQVFRNWPYRWFRNRTFLRLLLMFIHLIKVTPYTLFGYR